MRLETPSSPLESCRRMRWERRVTSAGPPGMG